MHHTEAFKELEQGVHAALETYSNVHRGSGHFSLVSTGLFEHARDIVLEYMGLNKNKYIVIFCSPRSASLLTEQLKPGKYKILSSLDFGIPLGIRALAAERKALPGGIPSQTGGGTARLVSHEWVIWSGAPDRFEAGTPAIINIIAFARALCLAQKYGEGIFKDQPERKITSTEIIYRDEFEKYEGKELLGQLRQTLIGRNISVPTVEGIRPFINLDNSASTSAFKSVWEAVAETWCQPLHIQKEIINEVKSVCSSAMGAPLADYEIIFTSNTTESINLAARNFRLKPDMGTIPVILSTLLEHSSNDLPWRNIPGSSLIRLQADNEGFLDLNRIESIMSAYNQKGQYGNKRIRLVSVSGASNVLGTYNDITEISRIVHKYGAHLLVDAAQMVAHRKVDMKESGIDYLAFSAHKVYAPFGTGVLIARKSLINFNSDEMELIRSSGEENAGGIAGIGKALVLLQRIGMAVIREEEMTLTRRLLLGMSQIDGLRIFGIKDPDSELFAHKGGVVVFEMKGMMANRVAKELAEYGGIGVRYGCHCAHILIKHLLGVGPQLERFQRIIVTLFTGINLPGLSRVSIGLGNSVDDIDTFIQVLRKLPARRRKKTDILKQIEDFKRATVKRVYS